MLDLLLVAIGAAILIFAGDFLVRGAVALSLRLGLSPSVIGLTVVAFGTSAPELVICVQAALEGSPDIATGNIVGSNIANILLVIGLAALITPIRDSDPETLRNYLIMVGASLLLLVLAPLGEIGRLLGAAMVVALALILYQAYRRGGTDAGGGEEIDTADGALAPSRIGFLLGAGIIGLPVGAHLLIVGAQALALGFGISEAAIGLTLVALGTSLPELAATVMAAYRGRTEVALGNAIGSNLFNILGILGITALVMPVPIAPDLKVIGIPFMIGSALVLLPFLWNGWSMARLVGTVFVLAYGVFAYLSLAQ